MKNKPVVSVIFIIFVILFLSSLFYFLSNRVEIKTFSETQEWDPEIYDFQFYETNLSEEDRYSLNTDAPKINFRKEVRELKKMVEQRTPEKIYEIESENDTLELLKFNGKELGEIIDNNLFLNIFLSRTMPILNAITVQEKKKHDVIRPSYYDSSLTTVVNVPGHPAYPSGHSTQAHFIAHVLSWIDPNNTEIYFEDAWRVATNREIAGLHYRSDSIAGKELAENIFNLLIKDDSFSKNLDVAKTLRNR